MRRFFLFPRWLALFLSLSLSLPSPALALRTEEIRNNPRRTTGLEEALKPAAAPRAYGPNGPEAGLGHVVILEPVFSKLEPALQPLIRRYVAEVGTSLLSLSDEKRRRRGKELIKEFQRLPLTSAAQKDLSFILESMNRPGEWRIDFLRWINAYVLLPNRAALFISGVLREDGTLVGWSQLFPAPSYELFKVPGVRIPLAVIYTPEGMPLDLFANGVSGNGLALVRIRPTRLDRYLSMRDLKAPVSQVVQGMELTRKEELLHAVDSVKPARHGPSSSLKEFLKRYTRDSPVLYELSVNEIRVDLRQLASRELSPVALRLWLREHMSRSWLDDIERRLPKGGKVSPSELAELWVGRQFLNRTGRVPSDITQIRRLAREIWRESISPTESIEPRLRRLYPQGRFNVTSSLWKLAQEQLRSLKRRTAGLEEEKVSARQVRELFDRVRSLLDGPDGQRVPWGHRRPLFSFLGFYRRTLGRKSMEFQSSDALAWSKASYDTASGHLAKAQEALRGTSAAAGLEEQDAARPLRVKFLVSPGQKVEATLPTGESVQFYIKERGANRGRVVIPQPAQYITYRERSLQPGAVWRYTLYKTIHKILPLKRRGNQGYERRVDEGVYFFPVSLVEKLLERNAPPEVWRAEAPYLFWQRSRNPDGSVEVEMHYRESAVSATSVIQEGAAITDPYQTPMPVVQELQDHQPAAAGLEQSVDQVLNRLAGSLEPAGVLVIGKQALESRAGLEQLVRIAPDLLLRRMVFYAVGEAWAARLRELRPDVTVIENEDVVALLAALLAMPPADRVAVLSKTSALAQQLQKIVPPSMVVTYLELGVAFRFILAALGAARAKLDAINTDALEAGLEAERAA